MFTGVRLLSVCAACAHLDTDAFRLTMRLGSGRGSALHDSPSGPDHLKALVPSIEMWKRKYLESTGSDSNFNASLNVALNVIVAGFADLVRDRTLDNTFDADRFTEWDLVNQLTELLKTAGRDEDTPYHLMDTLCSVIVDKNETLGGNLIFVLGTLEAGYYQIGWTENTQLWEHPGFIKAAAQIDPDSMRYADRTLKDNKEFMTEVVRVDWHCMEYASVGLRKDFAFMMEMAEIEPDCLQFAEDRGLKTLRYSETSSYPGCPFVPPSGLQDHHMGDIKGAAKQDPGCLRFASESVITLIQGRVCRDHPDPRDRKVLDQVLHSLKTKLHDTDALIFYAQIVQDEDSTLEPRA